MTESIHQCNSMICVHEHQVCKWRQRIIFEDSKILGLRGRWILSITPRTMDFKQEPQKSLIYYLNVRKVTGKMEGLERVGFGYDGYVKYLGYGDGITVYVYVQTHRDVYIRCAMFCVSVLQES